MPAGRVIGYEAFWVWEWWGGGGVDVGIGVGGHGRGSLGEVNLWEDFVVVVREGVLCRVRECMDGGDG